MATIPFAYIQQNDIIGTNLLPIEYSFEKDSTFTTIAGTGTSIVSDIYYNVFSGKYGLTSTNLDYQNTDYSFWLTDVPYISTFDGYAILSFYVNDMSDSAKVSIELFIDGLSINLYTFDTANNEVSDDNLWRRYAQRFLLSVGQEVTLKVTIEKDTSSSSPTRQIYFDAFKLEIDDKGVGLPSIYISPEIEQNATELGFTQLTTTEINALTPTEGLTVYNTTLHVLCFYDGTDWKKVTHSNM